MILQRCYIENFGRLCQYTFDFEHGFNVIHAPNGWGKTTFAVFIKTMFYGIDEPTRKKYKPWQGGRMGGYLIFEQQGKKYRLQRFFGERGKDDTFVIYDEATNLPSGDYSEKIGEEIFHLDHAAYVTSMYLPQSNMEVKGSDSLAAKLANLSEADHDMNAFEDALGRMDQAMKYYRKRGKKGRLDTWEDEIALLRERIRKGEADNLALDRHMERKQQLLEQLDEYKKKRRRNQESFDQASREGEWVEKKNHYLSLRQEKDSLQVQLQALSSQGIATNSQLEGYQESLRNLRKQWNQMCQMRHTKEEILRMEEIEGVFAGKIPTGEWLDTYLDKSEALQEMKADLRQKSDHLGYLQQQVVEEGLPLGQEEISKEHKSSIWIEGVFAVTSVAAMIYGFVMLPNHQILGILGFALAVVFAMFAGMMFLRHRSERKAQEQAFALAQEQKLRMQESQRLMYEEVRESKRQIELVQRKHDSLEEEISSYLLSLSLKEQTGSFLSIFHQLKAFAREYSMIVTKSSNPEIALLSSNYEQRKEEFARELGAYGEELLLEQSEEELFINMETILRRLEARRVEFETTTRQLKAKQEQLQDFEAMYDMEEVLRPRTYSSPEALKQTADQLEREMDMLQNELLQSDVVLTELMTKAEELPLAKGDLKRIEEDLEQGMQRYEILEKTKMFLMQAKESFALHYTSKIEEYLAHYLEAMRAEDVLGKISMDVHLKISVEEYGDRKAMENYSRGYVDLLQICQRFALVDALFEKEAPFVLLDDPFVNLDEDKTMGGLRLLKKLAGDRQMIYMTCHESRMYESLGLE